MSVILTKGENTNIVREHNSEMNIKVCLGWELRLTDGEEFDLDCSVFMLGKNGKVRKDNDFIFFNNLNSDCGAVFHQGDNTTGEQKTDDEVVYLALSKIPEDVEKLVFTVSIFDHIERQQNFGQVNNSYIKMIDCLSNNEIAHYDLTEDASQFCSMIFGQLYRFENEWKFKAIGKGLDKDLDGLAKYFGVI